MACKLCETRRPRRYCPGVGGDICSVCCGTERENTVNCPFDCPYLKDARSREKPTPIPDNQLPNRDVEVTRSFLENNTELLGFLINTVSRTAMEIQNVVDLDVRDALESLTRTYRTLQSGLYYETRPSNLIAAGVHQRVQQNLDDFRKQAAERAHTIRDAEVLGVLVFMQRTEMQLNNGRKRGRAFLDFLQSHARSRHAHEVTRVLPA